MSKINAEHGPLEIAQKQRHLFLLSKIKENKPLTKIEFDELTQLEKKNTTKTVKDNDKRKQTEVAAAQLVASQKEAAEYAGVDERTIRRWVAGGMPRAEDGSYIKSMLDFFKTNKGKESSEDLQRQHKAEADYKEVKAKLAQMEYDIKVGRLIRLEQIEKDRLTRIQVVKQGLLGLGRKLAKRLVHLKDEAKIQAAIDEEARFLIEGFASGK